MDITAKVTVVMEGMTKLLPTIATAIGIIATSRMVMGKYPGEVVIKIATNHTKLFHLQLTLNRYVLKIVLLPF